jgi:FkbM family methyltransferase
MFSRAYLKYSWLGRVYRAVRQPAVRAAHLKEVRLYRAILGDGAGLIFDIGAYDGHKTAAFLEMGARVVACEPDTTNFQLLKIRFRKERVIVLHTAVGDREGMAPLLIHHPGSAFNTLNPKWKDMLEADGQVRWKEDIHFEDGERVPVTTLDELIRVHGVPDLIKIDVEGYEKAVFDGLSQRVPCVSFECQLPEFRDDLLAILWRLKGSAFNVVYAEELVLPEWVGYERIVEWTAGTELFSFDIVAK